MSQHYNILRTEKVKNRTQITDAAGHNFRIRVQDNIDSSKSHLNEILVNSLGANVEKASDLQIKLTDFYDGLGIKEKKDNVLMMEFVVSASPDFFVGKNKPEIMEWASSQVGFFKNEFGEQLKIAVLHLDETTPHIHFMIGTEIKSVKNYKNKYGSCQKETWSLNADRYNPQFLTDLHTRHYEWNRKKYPQLRRGVKGSMREHKSLKEFYDVVDRALSTDYDKKIESTIDSLEKTMMGNVSINEIRDKFAPILKQLLKQNKALKEKYSLDLRQMLIDIAEEKIKINADKKEVAELKELYGNFVTQIKQRDAEIESKKKEIEALKKLIPKQKEQEQQKFTTKNRNQLN